MKKLGKLVCVRCGWEWIPKKLDPRTCPYCKSYTWRASDREKSSVLS